MKEFVAESGANETSTRNYTRTERVVENQDGPSDETKKERSAEKKELKMEDFQNKEITSPDKEFSGKLLKDAYKVISELEKTLEEEELDFLLSMSVPQSGKQTTKH